MNYQQFVTEVKEKVKDILGDSLKVEVVTTLKNNGAERIGISIIDSGINISPTIYLEEFYHFHNCTQSLDYIAEEIISIYEEIKFDHNIDINYIKNFSLAKHSIGYKLICQWKNHELLEKIPHKNYLEFAIIFVLYLDSVPNCQGIITITNELLDMWGKDVDDIYEIAHHNMPLLCPFSLVPMHEMVCELLDNSDSHILEDSPLYILTNEKRLHGASTLLYEDALEYAAKKIGESFYVLPSSIHELILVPESVSPNWEDLDKMISEVNDTQIAPEEILGENAWYYDAVLHRLL